MTSRTRLAVAISRGIPLQMIAPASLYSKKDADPNLEAANADSQTPLRTLQYKEGG